MALVMSQMPDVWRKVLAEHVADPGGRCRACRNANGETATWPCQTYRVAQEAKWVAEGNLPGTGPHGPGPSAAPRLSPLDDPRTGGGPAPAPGGFGGYDLPGTGGYDRGGREPQRGDGGYGDYSGYGAYDPPSTGSRGGYESPRGYGGYDLPGTGSYGGYDLPGTGSYGGYDLPSTGGYGDYGTSGSYDAPRAGGHGRSSTGGYDLPGYEVGLSGYGSSREDDDAASAFGGQGANAALASLPPLPPSTSSPSGRHGAPDRAPEPAHDERPSRPSWLSDEQTPYGSRVDAPYGSTFGIDDRPRSSWR